MGTSRATTCRTCRHLDVPLSASGRRVPMHNGFYRCRATAPDIRALIPASVYRHVAAMAHEVERHSGNAMMQPGWGEGCPMWKQLETKTKKREEDARG